MEALSKGREERGQHTHPCLLVCFWLAVWVQAGPKQRVEKRKACNHSLGFITSFRFVFSSFPLSCSSPSLSFFHSHTLLIVRCACVCVCVYLRLHSSFFLVSSHPPSLPPSLPLLSFMPASFQEEGREGRREGGREGACGVAPRGLSVRCLSGFRSAGGGKERGREGRWDGRGK